MQEREIIITDKSRWHGGMCIYGYDDEYNGVRPILLDETKELRGLPHNLVKDIKPFQRVKFRFISSLPSPPHTEDWLMDESYFPKITGELPENERKVFLEKILFPSLKGDHWGTEIRFYHSRSTNIDTPYIEPGEGKRSIITIKPQKISFVKYSLDIAEDSGKQKEEIRVEFTDMKGEVYYLKVTDLRFREYCDILKRQGLSDGSIGINLQRKLNNSDVFLRIGTGRPFRPRESDKYYCFLFITAIYSFPNYTEIPPLKISP